MKKTVVLTEKPDFARNVQSVIAPGAVKKDGYMEDDKYIITYAFGHILELAEPHEYDPKYQSWNIEDLPIIPEKFKLIITKEKIKQFKILKQLLTSPDAGELILATDAGREGQLIGEYIIMGTGCRLPVKRLWITSLTDEAIKKGFNNLQPGGKYKGLADAARCRSEMDWIVGINGTRAMTKKSNTVLNVGRVVTPTLAFIVNREIEIRNFISKPFFEVIAVFGNKYAGKWYSDKEDRFYKKEDALKIIQRTRGKTGVVTEVTNEEKQENPPLLHDLADLQKEANKVYGYSAAKTLEIAQALYEKHKILSYPRTDCRYLDSTQKEEIPKILTAIKDVPEIKEHVPTKITISKRVVNDQKMAGSDHHAIIPTEKKPNLNQLSQEEKNIFYLVIRRFVAAFLSSYKYKKTIITTEVEGETFRTSGKVNLELGWKILYAAAQEKDEEEEEENVLPVVNKGERYLAEPVDLKEGKTSPPKRYTEATLLDAMETAGRFVEDEEQKAILKEKKGIGTPATRAEIIEKLVRNKFIEKKNKTLIPTEFGMKAIELIPVPDLKSAELTAIWEQKLKEVEKGTLARPQLMTEIKDYTKNIIGLIKNTSQQDLSQNKNEPVGKCPKCGGDVVEGNKGYFCSNSRSGKCDLKPIWKLIAKKKISKTAVKQLLTKGITTEIKGFKGKKGEFAAKLKLEINEVKFDFSK